MSETYTYKGLDIVISQDLDAENPRTAWDQLGTMYCEHNRYTLGDKDADDIRDMDKENHYQDFKGIILPLYLYDHSGITMSTSGFSCPWDSGQVGYIYVADETIKREYKVKRISNKLRNIVRLQLIGEVETYDQYLTGDVYGFSITDTDGELLESVWGYYGTEDCQAEAESIADCYLNEQHLARQAKLKQYIKNHVPLQARFAG